MTLHPGRQRPSFGPARMVRSFCLPSVNHDTSPLYALC